MTIARLNYDGNDIDFAYGVRDLRENATQERSQNRSASGIIETVNQHGITELALTMFFDADTKKQLDAAWWGWMREGAVFEFGLDKTKMGKSLLTYANHGKIVDHRFFDTDNDWVLNDGTETEFSRFIRLESTGADPFFRFVPSSTWWGGSYYAIRAKIRRVSGSDWEGAAYYSTSGHGYSGSYYKQISEPAGIDDDWVIATWYMDDLDAGGSDFVTNSITGIELYFFATSGTVYDVQWIEVAHYEKNLICDTTLFEDGDYVQVISVSDGARERVQVDTKESTQLYLLDALVNAYAVGDIVRHDDYYHALVSLDDRFDPQPVSGGLYYTANFRWAEVLG